MNDKSYETLLYSITANVIQKIIELKNIDEDTAFELFTSSKLYSYLENEETKVWQYSAYMLATLLIDELNGNLTLPEV